MEYGAAFMILEELQVLSARLDLDQAARDARVRADNIAVGDGVSPGNERPHTMSNQVRVGVIGTSGVTEFVHLTDLKSHPRARVTAICGRRDRNRAAELAATYDIPYIYIDYREMFAQAPLDAVIVAVPDGPYPRPEQRMACGADA